MPYTPWKYFFQDKNDFQHQISKNPIEFHQEILQPSISDEWTITYGPYHMIYIISFLLSPFKVQYFKKIIHLSGISFATKVTEFILTVTLNRWLTVMTRTMFRVTRIIQGGLLRGNTESYWQYSFQLKRALIERKQGVTCQYTSRHCHFTSVSERRTRTFGHII